MVIHLLFSLFSLPSKKKAPAHFTGLKALLKNYHVTVQPDNIFQHNRAAKKLKEVYQVAIRPSEDQDQESMCVYQQVLFLQLEDNSTLGDFSPVEIEASGAILEYISETQKGRLPSLAPPVKFMVHTAMFIDPAARKSLELTSTLTGRSLRRLLLLFTPPACRRI